MSTRARKERIVVALNTLGGKVVDMTSLAGGKTLVYNQQTDRYEHADFPTGGGVEPFPSQEGFPQTGESGRLYVATDTNTAYLWNPATEQYEPVGGVVLWADIQEKPTTIEGFGITDAWTKTQIGDPYTDYVPFFENELL